MDWILFFKYYLDTDLTNLHGLKEKFYTFSKANTLSYICVFCVDPCPNIFLDSMLFLRHRLLFSWGHGFAQIYTDSYKPPGGGIPARHTKVPTCYVSFLAEGETNFLFNPC